MVLPHFCTFGEQMEEDWRTIWAVGHLESGLWNKCLQITEEKIPLAIRFIYDAFFKQILLQKKLLKYEDWLELMLAKLDETRDTKKINGFFSRFK